MKKLKKWLIITAICFIPLCSNIIFANNLPKDLNIGGKYSYVNQKLTEYLSLHTEDSDKYMVKYAISKEVLDKWKEDIDASGQNKYGEFNFLTGEHAWAPAFIIEKSDNSTLAENVEEEADSIINAGMFTHILEEKKRYWNQKFKNKYDTSLQQMSRYVYDKLAFEFIALNTSKPKTQMFLVIHPETYNPIIYVFKQNRRFEFNREYIYAPMWNKKINETFGKNSREQIINQIERYRNRKITPSPKPTASQSATVPKVIVVTPKRKLEEHSTLSKEEYKKCKILQNNEDEYFNTNSTIREFKPSTAQKQQKAKGSSSSCSNQNSTTKPINSYFLPFKNNNTKSSPEEDKVDVDNNSAAIPPSLKEEKVDVDNNSSAIPPSLKEEKVDVDNNSAAIPPSLKEEKVDVDNNSAAIPPSLKEEKVDVDNSVPKTEQKKKQPTKTNTQQPIKLRDPPKKRKRKNKQDGPSPKKQLTLHQFMK